MNKRKKLVSLMAGFLAFIMLLSLLLSIIPAPASAASSSEIKKQINAMKEERKELEKQKEDVQNQYEKNEDEIADKVNKKLIIDQEIFLLLEEIELINEQLSAYALLIADKQDELDGASDRLKELNAKNKDRIRAMEEDGGLSYWSVLFKANSFSDLLDRLNMIDEIAAADRRRLKEMSEAAEKVADAQAELMSEKAELDEAKAELDAAYAELEEKNAAAQKLIDELVEKGFELQELYAQYEETEQQLLDEIAQKEDEYELAKELEWIAYMATYTTPPTTQPPTTAPTTAPTKPQENDKQDNQQDQEQAKPTDPPATEPPKQEPATNPDPWRVPCSYTLLSSPFGERESPTAGASTNHQGVDLAGPEGTPIYASRSGKVTTAKFSNSAGYYVTINHGDGFASIYMHMTNFVVSKGDYVSGGQLIGYMGSTGISTGPHLHFGIIYNGAYVNPANYVYLHP